MSTKMNDVIEKFNNSMTMIGCNTFIRQEAPDKCKIYLEGDCGSVLRIPDGVTHITSRQSVEPQSSHTIRSLACESVYIPDSVVEIEGYAFRAARIKNVYGGSNITRLRTSAFSICTLLKEVILPKVEYVDDMCFYGCKNLNTIVMPNAKEFSSYSLKACTSLSILDSKPNLIFIDNLKYLNNVKSLDLSNYKGRHIQDIIKNACSMSVILPEVDVIDFSASTSFGWDPSIRNTIYILEGISKIGVGSQNYAKGIMLNNTCDAEIVCDDCSTVLKYTATLEKGVVYRLESLANGSPHGI